LQLVALAATAAPLTMPPAHSQSPSEAAAQRGEPPRAAKAATPLSRDQIVALAAQIVRAGPRLSQIWPGYWPEDQPFIVHVAGQGALLISPGERPDGFVPIAADLLPPELRGRAFYHEGTMAGATRPFILNYPIGTGRAAILVNADPSAETVARLLLHEQFHAYQAGAFKGRERQFVDPLAVRDRVGFAAAAQTEKHVLAAAVSAKTGKERKTLLQHYFALRREREATIPEAVRLVEQGFERSEGTAKYVDRVAEAILFGKGDADVQPLLRAELTKAETESSPLANSSAPYATRWFRGRGYSTGAALSYFLSLYDPAWRLKIEQGAKLDELLEGHVERPRNPAALARRARKRFGYDEAVKTLGPAIREGEKSEIKSVEEFMALGSYAVGLQIDNPAVEQKPRFQVGFSGMNMALLKPNVTALPTAFVFNMSGPSLNLTVRQKPVLMNGETKPETTTAILKSAPRVEGRGELPPGEHRFDRLKVNGEGYELSLDRPAVVTVTPTSMHIRVEDER
jgi:hypothetical protein